MKQVHFNIARSMYRSGKNVFVFINNQYISIPPHSYINSYGVEITSITKHSFFLSCQKLRRSLKINKLKYFISETPLEN